MRQCLLMAVLVFFSSLGLNAQATKKEQTAAPSVAISDPASRADLNRATRKMEKIFRDAERKSAEREKALADEARQSREEADKRHEAQVKELRDRDAAEKENLRRAEAQLRKERMIYGASGIGLFVALAISGFAYKRRRSKTVEGNVSPTQESSQRNLALVEQPRFLIHGKSDIVSVRRFVNENLILRTISESSDSVEVPSILVLEKRPGHEEDLSGEFNCIVVLRKDGSVVVRFSKLPGEEFAWKNRNIGAAKVATLNKQSAA